MREKKRELARSTENREPIPFNPKTDFLPVNVNDLLSPFIACNELQRNVTNVVLIAAQGAFKLNFPPLKMRRDERRPVAPFGGIADLNLPHPPHLIICPRVEIF